MGEACGRESGGVMADRQEIALLLYQLIQAAEKGAEKEASASGVGLQYDR